MTRRLLLASRILVGVVFILSGLIKVNDVTGFAYKLEEYLHVLGGIAGFGFLKWFLPHVIVIGKTIAISETVLGFSLILGVLNGLTTALLAVLMVLFTILTGYSAVTGAVTDCGCFGDVLKISPWTSFMKDVVLSVMVFFLLIHVEDLHPVFKRKLKPLGFVLVGLMLGAVWLATYTFYNHLPPMDFRPYAIGEDLKANTQPTADGIPIAMDYVPLETMCDSSEFVGNTLLIVVYDMTAADTEAIKEAYLLGNEAKQGKLRVFMLTSSLSEVQDSLAKRYNPSFCVGTQDETVLKTMIRSNPGYLLLHNGVVIGKWHYNDRPSVELLHEKVAND